MPPVIDDEKCLKCTLCAQICSMDVFGPAISKQTPQVLYGEECWHCRACVLECPVDAIDLRYPLPMKLLYLNVTNETDQIIKQ